MADRLTSADALIAFMRKGWRVFPSSELQHTCDITDIENAPTVDAVEVVRCKDCEYSDWWGPEGKETFNCIRFLDVPPVTPDFYCAWGERKE